MAGFKKISLHELKIAILKNPDHPYANNKTIRRLLDENKRTMKEFLDRDMLESLLNSIVPPSQPSLSENYDPNSDYYTV